MKTPTVLETPCREWQGSRVAKGYGKRYVRGSGRTNRRSELIHRWVWSQINGPIPEGMLVLHRCDNPPCFRYDHLFLGTPADNSHDMVTKGRSEGQFQGGQTHCIHGHPFDEENTYYHASDGYLHRQCKACKNERNRRRRAKPEAPEIWSCDWGDCDNESVDSRWSPEHGWLPVCADHREQTS